MVRYVATVISFTTEERAHREEKILLMEYSAVSVSSG